MNLQEPMFPTDPVYSQKVAEYWFKVSLKNRHHWISLLGKLSNNYLYSFCNDINICRGYLKKEWFQEKKLKLYFQKVIHSLKVLIDHLLTKDPNDPSLFDKVFNLLKSIGEAYDQVRQTLEEVRYLVLALYRKKCIVNSQ